MINSEQDLASFCGIKSYFNQELIRIPFDLIKSTPENFIVKEILSGPSNSDVSMNLGKSQSGLFYHCLLTKKLIDTPSAVNLIAKTLKIPSDWVGYAGLKDSQGITHQRISIFNAKINSLTNLKFKNFSLSNFIRKRFEVQLGQLWGNNFYISLDPVQEKDNNLNINTLETTLTKLNTFNFPNYFGLQRFGTTRPVSHLVGKYLIKSDYKSAVMTYLTNISSIENKNILELRKKLYNDLDFDYFITNIPKNYYYELIMGKSLKKFPNNFFRAFNELPIRMRKFFVSSFQSYIFNELLSEYIKNRENDSEILPELPIISYNTDFSQLPADLLFHLENLLKKEDISKKDFLNIRNFFKLDKQQFRKTFVTLTNYSYTLSPKKLILNYSLPKSCYATMILRELKIAIK